MSLIIERYHFFIFLVEVYSFTYKILLVSTVLTNFKICFVVLVGILTTHFPFLKHEKQFLFILIYFCRTSAYYSETFQ